MSGSPVSCDPGEYWDPVGASCEACDAPCSTCSAAGTSSCTDCTSGFYLDGSNCVACDAPCSTCSAAGTSSCTDCTSGFYLDGSNCVACDPLCDTCTASGNASCSACAAQALSIPSTSICVSDCSDHLPNYYPTPPSCSLYHSSCASCVGPFEYQCNSCSPSSL